MVGWQYTTPMTLTLKELEAIATELDFGLSGGRLADASMEDDDTLVLTVLFKGEIQSLLLCTRAHSSRIHLTDHSRDTGHERRRPKGSMADLLYRYEGAAVGEIRTRYQDRVVAIPLSTEAGKRTLLFECSGHHPNVFLLDEAGGILASLRPSKSHMRDLRPGRRYAKPLQHGVEKMDSLRFLSRGRRLSTEIESHYDRMAKGQFRAMETAKVRRDLKSALEHYNRLADAITADIQKQEEAGRGLKTGNLPPKRRFRATRQVRSRSACELRLRRVEERAERLRTALQELEEGGQWALKKARALIESLPEKQPDPRSTGKRPEQGGSS